MAGRGAARPRVLMVTKFLPDGPPSGAQIRTSALLGVMRTRFDVSVVGYAERSGPRPRGRRSALMNALATRRPYQVSRWDTPWIRERIGEEMTSFGPDAIHIDHLQVAPLVGGLGLPRVLDMHNIESVLAAGVAASTRGPASWVAARDARLLRDVEREAAGAADLVLVSSHRERERAPIGDVEVVPNGVHGGTPPPSVPIDPDLLVFSGLFSWLPNIDGAEWFVHQVLPLIPPHLRVRLVGRDPDPRVRALAGPRVEVTGEVPEMAPHVGAAAVVLAPLLTTGGTRLKILEGLLAARPVVATPLAAEGLEDLAGRGLTLAASPSEFASVVTELAADPDRASRVGAEGRRAVLASYEWNAIGSRLLDLYESRIGLA
ncbi:MAG: glycosyltransferase family 4 protein [Dehalococcoidia bacterium]